MADLNPTVASVAYVSGTVIRDYNAGETITAGMAVYLKSSNTKWMKMQCDGAAEESGVGVRTGIALHGSLDGQPLAVQETGVITIGDTVVVGTIYTVSAAAGKICPHADLVSTNKVTVLAIAITSANLNLAVKNATGLAVP